MMRIGLRRHAFDFRDRDHWQEPQEQQEQREEQSKRSKISANVHPGRTEISPTARQEVAMQTDHNDHEAFEPHADVDDDRENENRDQILPEPFEPEKLRDDDITRDHRNPAPLIRPERTIHEMELFHRTAAVPRYEELHRIGVSND
jgi:hypothetical protein